jgi:uncharacterized membrane protein
MENTVKAPRGSLGRTLRTQFLAGIFILAPVGATVLILVWIFNSIDSILQPLLRLFFGHTVPGVGFGIVIVLIYVIGVVGTSAGRRLIRYAQSLLTRVPFVSWIYTTIKQIMDSFSAPGQTNFLQTVLVEYPRKGMRAIGFITNESVDNAGNKKIYVFIPTSPIPTSGFMEIANEEDLIRTDISINDAMKIIASGGKIIPKDIW